MRNWWKQRQPADATRGAGRGQRAPARGGGRPGEASRATATTDAADCGTHAAPPRPLPELALPAGLQIVDNLHPAVSNRNMHKAPAGARARSPDAPAGVVRRPSDRAGSLELAADAGRARAGADDRRRRICRRGPSSTESDIARAPRRFARPGARGLPRAGGIRTRPPRKEPRRIRPPDHARRSGRDLRAARRARRARRPARRAACRTAADVRELLALVDRMEQAAARGDADAYHLVNLAFHDRLVELAGNAKLLAMYRRLVNELNLYRRAALDAAGTLPVSVSEHRAIVERIAAGQAAAAGRLLHEHVMGSRDRAHRAREQAIERPATRPPLRAAAAPGAGPGRQAPLNTDFTKEPPCPPPLHRQRPRLPPARRTARRRLRRRLRARVRQPGHRRRPGAVSRLAA